MAGHRRLRPSFPVPGAAWEKTRKKERSGRSDGGCFFVSVLFSRMRMSSRGFLGSRLPVRGRVLKLLFAKRPAAKQRKPQNNTTPPPAHVARDCAWCVCGWSGGVVVWWCGGRFQSRWAAVGLMSGLASGVAIRGVAERPTRVSAVSSVRKRKGKCGEIDAKSFWSCRVLNQVFVRGLLGVRMRSLLVGGSEGGRFVELGDCCTVRPGK